MQAGRNTATREVELGLNAARGSVSEDRSNDSPEELATAIRESFVELICEGIDFTIRVGAVCLFLSSIFATSESDMAEESASVVAAWARIQFGLLSASAYWFVGSCVKLADDILDEEDEAFIRVINNASVVSPAARHALLVCLSLGGSTAAFFASLDPVAAVMMLVEVIGCLIAGKVDSIYHCAVLAAIATATALQTHESGHATAVAGFFGIEGQEPVWNLADLVGTTSMCVAGGFLDEIMRAVVKSRRTARKA